MRELLIRKNFVEKIVEPNRNVWELEIVSSWNQRYTLSYCKFSYGIVFTLSSQYGTIAHRSFRVENRKYVERYIDKLLGFLND